MIIIKKLKFLFFSTMNNLTIHNSKYTDLLSKIYSVSKSIFLPKFKRNLLTQFDEEKSNQIFELCQDKDKLLDTPVDEFMNMLAK